jgi:thioredoxin-like negative regulator of GroEL
MAPIVDGLAQQYQGRVAVRPLNANTDPGAEKLGVKVVPTYIFLDSAGKVLERQEGGNPQALQQGFEKAVGK